MSSVRNDVAFDDIDFLALSFKTDSSISFDKTQVGGSAQVGLAVTIKDAKTVGLVGDGEAVHGKIISVEGDDLATIQVRGGTELPAGTGATLTDGSKIVGAELSSAKGYIRSVASGTAAEVARARHTILDPDTTTAVKVFLGI